MRRLREWKENFCKNVYILYRGVRVFLLSLSNEVCCWECLLFCLAFRQGGKKQKHEEIEMESLLLHQMTNCLVFFPCVN